MLIREGVWDGPFIELQRSLFGPRGGAGIVRMWRCPACGTHYYHAERYWESQEKELDPERVEGEVLILPTHGGHGLRSASGKHYLTPHVFSFKVAKYLQFVPAAFSKAVLCNNEIATFKHPHCAYEHTLVACEMKQLDVPQRVCPRCYAEQIENDPKSVKIDLYFFRPTESTRFYSPNQPRVKQANFKDIITFESTRVTPEDARVLYRDYRWGRLGVLLLVEGDVVELYEQTFDGPRTARFENTVFVEFARVL